AARIVSWWKQPMLRAKAERAVVIALVLVALASLPEVNPRVRDDLIFGPTSTILRRAIRERVQAPAVVLVRYHVSENPHDEPVYNDSVAYPDDADVIVAHDLGARNVELLDYYERTQPGRRYYLFHRRGHAVRGRAMRRRHRRAPALLHEVAQHVAGGDDAQQVAVADDRDVAIP